MKWSLGSKPVRGSSSAKGAKVLSGSAQGMSTSWKLKLSGSRKNRVTREMMRKEKKWMEVSKRSEATLNDDTCACNMGWMRTWTNAVCDHLNKEKKSRDADTNSKEERLKTNKLSCGSIHSAHESLVDVFVSFHMLQFIPHVVGLVALCADFTSCQCTKLIHFLTCTWIPCRDSHCGNGLVRCCLYTPRRLQQTTVSCKRFYCNKTKSWKSTRLRFCRKTANNGSPRSIMSLCT